MQLAQFAVRSGLSITCCLELLKKSDEFGGESRDFKSGKFKGNDWALAERIADLSKQLRPFMGPRVLASKGFYRSLRKYYVMDKEVPTTELVSKYEVSHKKITVESSIKDYLRQFEDMLNWKRMDGKQIRLY